MLLLLPSLFVLLTYFVIALNPNFGPGIDFSSAMNGLQVFYFISLALIYPLLIAFYSYTLWRIEYSQNGITKLMTLPYKRYQIGLGKWLNMVICIILSALLALVTWSIVVYGVDLQLEEKGVRGIEYFLRNGWRFFLIKVIFTSITIGTIHFFLTFIVKNLITTLMIAFVAAMLGFPMLTGDYIDYYPYGTLLASTLSPKLLTNTLKMVWGVGEWINLGYTALFLLLSLFIIHTNRFKQN